MLAHYLGITDERQVLLIALASTVGALLPDIDHPQAGLRQRLGFLGDILFGWLKHRGVTHTAIAAALVTAAGWHLHPVYGLAVGAGYISHLIGDMTTKAGLTLLYPVSQREIHLLPPIMRITTGGAGERLIAVVLFTMLFWLLFAPIQDQVVQVVRDILHYIREADQAIISRTCFQLVWGATIRHP
jgi:inner membrane protein